MIDTLEVGREANKLQSNFDRGSRVRWREFFFFDDK